MLIFSCAIASMGLIANLSVVTIGAQLIDPLMSPILGLAIASLSGLQRMFKRAILAIFQGAAISVGLSSLISFLFFRLPYSINADIPREVLLRTAASPIDLGIALVGGAAAAYALAHPDLDAALPGVAIATAIMPPLCTIGFGIAFLNSDIILGAALQFLANFSAITFAAVVVFALLGFRPKKTGEKHDLSRSVLVSAVMMLIIAIPLAILSWNSVSDARLHSRASSIIVDNLPDQVRPKLVSLDILSRGDSKDMTATIQMVRELTTQESVSLRDALANQLGEPVSIRIVTLPVQFVK